MSNLTDETTEIPLQQVGEDLAKQMPTDKTEDKNNKEEELNKCQSQKN